MKQFGYVMLCVAFGWLGAFQNSLAEGNFIQLNQQQIENLGIKIGKLKRANQVPLFSAPAKVVVPPENDFIVSAPLAGLVVKMNVSVGDKVSKGDVIGLINSPELLTLQGNYLKAVSAMTLASVTYHRDKKLNKEGIVSGRSEQESYSVYKAAEIEVNEAKQLLQIVGMTSNEIKQLDTAGQLMRKLVVRSPVSGRVLERMAATGSRVDNQAPLYRVANLDVLWLEINVPQEHINDIKIGEKILVEGGQTEAEIRILGQGVNPENQTVLARATIKDAPNTIRVGQKLTIQHMQESVSETYLLNDVAIAHHNGKAYIFLKENDGFKVSEIKTLGQQSGASVISGTFSGGEEIAINNSATLKAIWLGLGSDN
jgi:cobalt-zinc-cadmium efflux system membrane fusion protein